IFADANAEFAHQNLLLAEPGCIVEENIIILSSNVKEESSNTPQEPLIEFKFPSAPPSFSASSQKPYNSCGIATVKFKGRPTS
ncbi:MAG: hypothetical protein KJS68_10290, partial [Alphaproteobacteria bacterium]|nr:hypothetical protein [Alphaproteobacteria bacterium]